MIKIDLVRQEAEALIELLEEKPDEPLHDSPRGCLAAFIRGRIGRERPESSNPDVQSEWESGRSTWNTSERALTP